MVLMSGSGLKPEERLGWHSRDHRPGPVRRGGDSASQWHLASASLIRRDEPPDL